MKPLGMAALLWLFGVGSGMVYVSKYKATPGETVEPSATWPAEVTLERRPGLPTLVMLAHPKCPCTRASIAELARLMERIRNRVNAKVVFLSTRGGAEFSRTDLWSSAARIPGVEVTSDPEGAVAGRFGAVTSGEVLVYDASGRLAFHGGITPARGHEGESAGRIRILDLIEGRTPDRADAPVFGCSLREPSPEGRK